MKNAKLIIDGKEIEVTVSEETLEKLTNRRTTGYERVSLYLMKEEMKDGS